MFNHRIHSAQENSETPCRQLPRSGALTIAASRQERHFKKLTLKIHLLGCWMRLVSFRLIKTLSGSLFFIFVAFKSLDSFST